MTPRTVVIIASVTWSIIETGHSESLGLFPVIDACLELPLGYFLTAATPTTL